MGRLVKPAGEETFFLSKIEDLFATAQRRQIPKFSAFLDESQIYLVNQVLSARKENNWMLWGGYEGAKRQMLGVFPDYMEPDPAVFPIEPFTFHYRKSDQLTHRDFLGSLMGLQLKRETVGDILVSEGNCVLFVTDKVSPLVQNEVQKIGRVGVRVSAGIQVPISTEQRFQELVGTVASLRLDCVVAFFTGKSREKAGELIHSGMVFLNYREMAEKDVPVAPGDVITVRGYGKAQLSDQIKKTKKDRYLISLQKYIS